MESNYLKYGSLITLSTQEGFYLYSEGFIDSSAYLREQTEDFSEFSGAVFRVVSQCAHAAQSSIVDFTNLVREVDFNNKLNQLIKMEEHLEGELRTNIHIYNSLKGKVVNYNSLIQLEHLKSHKFLTLRSQSSAETEKDNFRITFEDFPSDYSHFRIVPSFKFQKQGSGKVKVFDKVYFEILVPELRKVAWMHGSKGQFIESLFVNNEEMFKGIEVNVSLDQKTRWSIRVYGDMIQDFKYLACGDCIWLNMPEESMGLTVVKDQWDIQKFTLNFTNVIDDTNGLWMIEYEEPFKGGSIEENKRYRLKHIVSGKYLASKNQLLLKSRATRSTLWKIVSYKNESLIKSDELCYLVHVKSGLSIRYASHQGISLCKTLDHYCICKPIKANSKVVWEVLFLLHCYPILLNFPMRLVQYSNLLSEDAKSFRQFDKYYELVLSCLKHLKLFVRNKLKTMIGNDNHYGQVQNSRQNMLQQQNFFEALAKMLSCSVLEGESEKFKQISLLRKKYKLHKTEDLQTTRIRKISVVISKIYILLINICDKNFETQKYAYRFIDVYIKHVGLNLGASKLLISILRNNEELMLKIHQDPHIDIINYYSNALGSFNGSRKIEFIEFLKSVCVFKGEAVSVNQEKVFASIFKDKSLMQKMMIFTEFEGNYLYIHIGNTRISLLSCFESGRIVGYEPEISYFTALLEFFSSLCKGRNFESSSLFIPMFPFEVLHTLIWNSDLTIPIRAAFCKLMLNMYIDCFMREEIEMPELIKIINSEDDPKAPQRAVTFKNLKLSNLKNGQIAMDSNHISAFQDSEMHIEELLERIFEYFESGFKVTDNELTLEIIRIVLKLVKFQILGMDPRLNQSNESGVNLSNQLGIVRVLSSIIPLLLEPSQGSVSHFSTGFKRKTLKLEKNAEDAISYTQYLSSILKDANSLNDPIIRSAANLKNYLTILKQNPFNGLDKKLISHRIRLKVCKVVEYFLDSRQDFLLNNIFEWYNEMMNIHDWEVDELDTLLPKVSLKEKGSGKKFKCYSLQSIPDVHGLFESDYLLRSLLNVFSCSDNYKLQTRVISIVLRSFRQRRELLKNVKRVHVMFFSKDISQLNWIKSCLLSFKHHSEQSELWMCYWGAAEEIQGKHREVFKKMIEVLKDIENFMYDDVQITEKGLSSTSSHMLSKPRQELLYYLNAHKLIVTLIKDGVHNLAAIYADNQQEVLHKPCELLTELFSSCYIVLRRFVYNNPRNQKKLHHYMHILFQYLYLPLGQIPLICEIYRENQTLVSSIDERLIKKFEDLIIEYGRQKEFLEPLFIIQVTNGKANQLIQRMVLSLFINEHLNTYMLYMNDEPEPVFIFDVVKKKNYFYKDEPFKYHAALLKVLSNCGYGVSGMLLNEIKCQHTISLNNIFTLLFKCEESHEFRCLKLPVLDFFYNIYLDCEIINLELKTFTLFFEYIYLQCKILEDLQDISEEYMDFLKIWVKILNKYRSSYIKKVDSSYFEQADIRALREFVETLVRNSEIFEDNIHGKLLEEILELCKQFKEAFEISMDSEVMSERSPIARNGIRRTFTTIDLTSMNSAQSDRWDSIKSAFIYNKMFKERIEAEEFALVSYIMDLDIGKIMSQYTLSFEKFMMSLISFVRISISQKPPVQILVMVIELIENILSRSNNSEESNKTQQKINMQNKLNFYGLTDVILTLMIDNQLEDQVFKSLISLSIELLDGGNYQSQQEFYQFFLTASNSEVLFFRVSEFFERKITKFAEPQDKKNRRYPVYKTKKNSIKNLLRFLQLLCENHNHSLQKYLRYQEKSTVSYNLIASVINLLEILMKKKYFTSFFVISQCFETLTELIQGPCLQNQEEIINSSFLNIANELLALDESSSSLQMYKGLITASYSLDKSSLATEIDYTEEVTQLTGWMVAHLKNKCLITILSLFEGRKDSLVSTRVIRLLSLEALQENIKNMYVGYLESYSYGYYDYGMFNHSADNEKYDFYDSENPQDLRPHYYSLIIENGFKVYQLLKTLQDGDDLENQEALFNDLPIFFALDENENKTYMDFTSKNKLRKIKESVMRYKYSGIELEKNNELVTRAAYWFFKEHTGNIEVVFAGEIFRVYFYYPPEYHGLTNEIKEYFHRHVNRESDQSKLKYMIDRAILIIEQIRHEFYLTNIMKKSKIVHFIASNVWIFSKLAYFLTILLNLIILTSYTAEKTDESAMTFEPWDAGIGYETTESLLIVFGLLQLCCCLLIVAFFLLKVGPLLARKGWEKNWLVSNPTNTSQGLITRFFIKFMQISYTIIYIMSDKDVIYYTFYSIFSILGIFLHPFYFSLLLLDIIYRNPALQNVVNSIVLPRKALILTFILIIVVVYMYAILGYWLLEDYFKPNCKSLLQCLLTVWDKSFKNNGGIGGFLPATVTPTIDPIRFFYDNIYNLLVMVVLMGVVQGIIIDTFARLREDFDSSKMDQHNKCFICGLQRDFIEKRTVNGFVYHVTNEHNEWNYILFLAYLLEKEQTEYTGIESFVREQFEMDELGWIPNQRALSVNNVKQEDIAEKIKVTGSRLSAVENIIQKIADLKIM